MLRRLLTASLPLLAALPARRALHASAPLAAEPLKKKRRQDPQVELERVRRKTRRIEKEIKRMEQLGRYLKPLEEIEGDRQFLRTLAGRERQTAQPPAQDELERRALLAKDWTRFKWRQTHAECSLLADQRRELYRALEHLKALDRGLFELATQPDDTLALDGFTLAGPRFTPPVPGAELGAVDGDYRDITPTYQYSFEMDRKMTFNKKK